MKCKGAIYRSLNSLEAKQPLQAAAVASKGRVSKAGLAVLNKELYGHIYSCRKTLRRLLTFGSQAVCASSFTTYLFLSLSDLSFSLLFFSFLHHFFISHFHACFSFVCYFSLLIALSSHIQIIIISLFPSDSLIYAHLFLIIFLLSISLSLFLLNFPHFISFLSELDLSVFLSSYSS